MEAHLKMNDLQTFELQDDAKEAQARVDARRQSLANDFAAQMMAKGLGNQEQAMAGQAQGQ
jgi:hypothetical protein